MDTFDINMTLGEFVKDKRIRHELSQSQLSYDMKSAQSVLSRIERGEQELSLDYAYRLDEAFGDSETSAFVLGFMEEYLELKSGKDIMDENYRAIGPDGMKSITSFIKLVSNIAPLGANFSAETPHAQLYSPIKRSPSGSWTWVKRELNTELKVLGIPINRVHISRSMAVDMGTTKIWNTETEMFTSFLDPDPEQMLSTVTPITKDLLELAPNGGVIHWDAINKLREDKHIPSNTLVNHFLFGNDQIAFVPLENLETRKVFVSVAGPSFDYDQFELIKATSLNFISRYM